MTERPARFRIYSRRFRDLPRTNRLTRLLERCRAAGDPVLDLTCSNPTRVGLELPSPEVREACRRVFEYRPHPAGLPEARRAVAAYYAARGWSLPASRVVLTSSTSEAYLSLFKLLADPGDAILVPRPSYPLFEHLAALESLRPVAYDLEQELEWRVDLERFEALLESENPRAVIAVHPNNPTGSLLRRLEWRTMLASCRRRGVPLIVDEVFYDYRFRQFGDLSLDRDRGVPVFVLNGLSKTAALPQVKAAWIAAGGPPEVAADALQRLEMILDQTLTVSTPAQRVLEAVLPRLDGRQRAVRERLRGNLERVRGALAGSAAQLLEPDGGWSAILRLPRVRTDEQWALRLLERRGVLVHPGYFYDLRREGCLVLSLLTPPGTLGEALQRMLEELDARGPIQGKGRRG